MSGKRKYMLMTLGVLFAFIYIMETEVLGRWESTISRYAAARAERDLEISPDSLGNRRRELRAQVKALTEELEQKAGRYGRSFSGFLSHASSSAKDSRVKLVSVIPVSDDEGPENAQGFKIECRGSYHAIGTFINRLENSPLDIHMRRVSLKGTEARTRGIESVIEGRFLLGLERRGKASEKRKVR